jgi:hypothetical protein
MYKRYRYIRLTNLFRFIYIDTNFMDIVEIVNCRPMKFKNALHFKIEKESVFYFDIFYHLNVSTR